jgi:hypothetical protein
MAKSQAARKPGDRPFPWRCPRCLAVDVQRVVTPYTAKVEHDGCEYTIDIPALRVPKCGSCGELVFSNDVDEQIRQALRRHLRGEGQDPALGAEVVTESGR